jgi:hypothetical protein
MDDSTQSEQPYPNFDRAVYLARIAGLSVIAATVILAIRTMTIVDDDRVWIFLQSIVSPFALGLLILVAAEILNSLRNGNNS